MAAVAAAYPGAMVLGMCLHYVGLLVWLSVFAWDTVHPGKDYLPALARGACPGGHRRSPEVTGGH